MVDVLPALIAQLKVSRPDLTVSIREIVSVEAVSLLESGDIDLAFARLEGKLGTGIQCVALHEDRLAVALPSGHFLAGKSRIRLHSLSEEDFVVFFRRVSPGYFDSLITACREAGFSPRIVTKSVL